MLDWAGRVLAMLRKIKSESKVSMKTPILSATISVESEGFEFAKSSLSDVCEAARAEGEVKIVEAAAENAVENAVENAAGKAASKEEDVCSDDTADSEGISAGSNLQQSGSYNGVTVVEYELGEPPAKPAKKA